ncbi:MAG: hypothetical protein ACJ8GK_05935 [Luteimonas sp.]
MASIFAEVRALHILVAAAWFGAAAFLTLYLMPALGQLGPQGAPVLRALDGRRFHRFMAANAGLTLLSGGWLYWVLTAGFSPQVVASRSGVVFGIGGLAGVLAAVIGASLVGGSAKRLAGLSSPAPETVAILQRRIRTGSRLALTLMLLALLAMTLGHAA